MRALTQAALRPAALGLALLALITSCGDDGTEPRATPTTLEAVGEQAFTVSVAATPELRVRVLDQRGNGMGGVTVSFTANGGSVAPANPVTDASGIALAVWNVGKVAGEFSATASVPGLTPVGFTATVRPGPVSRIEVGPTGVQLRALGDTVRMSATPMDAHSNVVPDAEVVWSSGDETVVIVDQTGLVTAIGPGSTTVRARVGAVQQGVVVSVVLEPAQVSVSPASHHFTSIGAQHQFTVEVRDASGAVIPGAAVSWSTTDPAVVQVSSAGLATSTGVGAASIVATAGAVADTVAVTVRQVPASLSVTPDSTDLLVGDTVRLTAQVRDAAGTPIPGASIAWATDAADVASVTPDGLVTAEGAGSATITATHGTLSGSARVRVFVPPKVVDASTSSFHTCAVTDDGRAFCWGWGGAGALGTGNAENRTTPTQVAGTDRYEQITTAVYHTCALRQDGAALCWGQNFGGMLGNGGTAAVGQPVLVAGGHTFVKLETQLLHTCGLEVDGSLWCWGNNADGQLGVMPAGEECTDPDGNVFPCRKMPVRAGGEHTFIDFSVGWYHTCGVKANGETYCWGWNGLGQLGNGTAADSSTHEAQLVQGTGGYTRLALGAFHSCGVRPDGTADCWGMNANGQLGNGQAALDTCTVAGTAYPCSTRPSPISGGHTFADLAAGRFQTCGIVQGDDAYCWGANPHAVLGDGTTTQRTVPTRTLGPAFAAITIQNAGETDAVACGTTADGALYCWGSNPEGQIGDGTTTPRTQPTLVTLPPAGAAASLASQGTPVRAISPRARLDLRRP